MSSSSIDIRCVSHLGITVIDLAASVDFYTSVLGFTICYEDIHKRWTRVGLALGDTVIELFTPHEVDPSFDEFDPFYPVDFGRPKIALTVGDAEAASTALTAVGITPSCSIISTSRSKFFFIADPDGTPIQLQEFLGEDDHLARYFNNSR